MKRSTIVVGLLLLNGCGMFSAPEADVETINYCVKVDEAINELNAYVTNDTKLSKEEVQDKLFRNKAILDRNSYILAEKASHP